MKRIAASIVFIFIATQVFGQLNIREYVEDLVLFTGTGSIKVPTGNTSQRPGSPDTGYLRYNSEEQSFEGYNGTEWGAIGSGGGGDAGINFVADASFEKEELNLDSSTGATETYETHTTDDKLYSEFNTKYFKSSYTGLSAADLYVRDTFSRTGLDGKQGLLSIWIKTDASNLDLCLRTDDATFTNACDSAYLLNVIGDNTWRKYEIPFVFGAASVQFEIFNESYTGNANIEVDKIYIGTIPDGYIETVGQAQFVGDINFNSSSCIWTISTGTAFQSFPVDADCVYQTRGNVLKPDTNIPAIKIPNARTDGYYQVVFNGVFGVDQASSSDTCIFNLSDSTSRNQNGGFAYTQTSPGTTLDNNRIANEITGEFKFATSGDKTIQVLARPNAEGDSCSIFSQISSYGGTIAVHFFPDSTSTVVTQNTELTAQTANEFKGRVDDTSVFANDFDIMSCSCTSGISTCTYSYDFAEAPTVDANIQVDATDTSLIEGRVETMTTTGFTFSMGFSKPQGVSALDARTPTCYPYTYTISKKGSDYNKSARIIGKFENINSSELVKIRANQLTGATSTTSFAYNYVNTLVKLEDNYNALTDTGDIVFTAPKTSHYNIDFQYRIDYGATVAESECGLTIVSADSNSRGFVNYWNGVNHYNKCIFDNIKLNAGDTVKFFNRKSGTASVTWNTDLRYNSLSINELPDTSSIVKNLLAESSQTKCQTKYLSADLTADTDPITDLTFNNLEIGKKYKISYSVLMDITNDPTIIFTVSHNGSEILRTIKGNKNASGILTQSYASKEFVATATTLTFEASSGLTATTTINGNGTDLETNATLCQLPDTYVETTEW